MDPQLTRKDFVTALISVLSLAIDRDRIDDADTVLTALRALRPQMHELDTFEAWLAMKRQAWPEATRILRNLDATLPTFQTARAFLAMCLYMTGDPSWRAVATDVAENSSDADAVAIASGLLQPETVLGDDDAQAEAAGAEAAAPLAAMDTYQFAYAMRV
jgi:type III secretion protein HrpB1